MQLVHGIQGVTKMDVFFMLAVIVASLFRNAGSVPAFVKPIKESVFAAVGEPAKFSLQFTGGFSQIDFGTSDGDDLTSLIIRVFNGEKLKFSVNPKYQGRISWAGNKNSSPVEAVFILSNVSQADSSKYICKVLESASEIKAFVDLIVTDANIVEHPQSAICQTFGGEVDFTCNATGTPHPNVTWVKGEEEIGESSSVKIVRDGKGYSRLTIKNCGREDVLARYRCKATNPPDLEVFSKPAELFFAFTANDTAEVDKNSSPSSVTGAIEVETTLRCAFRSYPPPSINWTLPNGDSTQTQLPFLVIKPMSSEQFGNYTCSADGFQSRTITLAVETDDVPIINVRSVSPVDLTWGNDTKAKYFVVSGTEEGSGRPFLAIADNKTVNMTLNRKSEVISTENKDDLKYTLEVRAIANAYNRVIKRYYVVLESKARSFQAGFLAVVVAFAVGSLSPGFQ